MPQNTAKNSEQYPMHSLPEKANSGVKCRFEDPLRKGLDARKVTKTRLKLVGHDVRIIGYLGIMEGIKTHWFRG